MNERFMAMARSVELFKGIDPTDIEKIIARGATMTVPKGQVVFYEGTTGNQMFVVLGGKISVYARKKHLADLTGGHMFGEMSLISSEPRSATAVASEDSYLFALDESIFDKLMTKRVAIQLLLNIVASLVRRLKATNDKLNDLHQRIAIMQQEREA